MRLYSVCGDILFKSSYITIKESVEEAVQIGVHLDGINLRKANLRNAQLDSAYISNACFWGADLTNANMSEGKFSNSDFRTAIFKDTCLADSDFSAVNFQGAYFSKTLFDGSDLSLAQFSCPSIFSCDLHFARTLRQATYNHKGETVCALNKAPITIKGLEKLIVIMDDDLLIGQDHIKKAPFLEIQKAMIDDLQKRIIQS